MSDVPQTPDGAVETAQAAVEQSNPTPPWGDDFNAERAWKLVEDLRDDKEKLSSKASRYETDLDAFRELAEKHGFEIPDGDDEYDGFEADYGAASTDEEPYEDPYDSRLTRLEQWEQEQRLRADLDGLSAHVDELASEANLELSDEMKDLAMRLAVQDPQKIGPQQTQEAFKTFLGVLQGYGERYKDEYLKSKRADPGPQPGTAGEQKFDPKSPNADQERQARIAARLTALGE